MIESSKNAPKYCDANGKCINNLTGKSAGVYGDGFKIGGGRIDHDELCKAVKCSDLKDNKITLTGKNGQPISWEEVLKLKPDLVSPLGGLQGGDGYINLGFFKSDYEPGSFLDKLVEAYAGTHDWLNSSYWYDKETGNIKQGMTQEQKDTGELLNIVNVVPATLFALSVLLPPEVWNAISIGLMAR
jgi:filamentous hemagglutinin